MIIYLGCPYSSSDPAVEDQRFEQICGISSELMSKGIHIFSPIAHCHSIRKAGGLPGHIEFWEEYDRKFLAVSGEFWIVTMNGWKESRGLRQEMEIARELLVPIRFLHPVTLNLTISP